MTFRTFCIKLGKRNFLTVISIYWRCHRPKKGRDNDDKDVRSFLAHIEVSVGPYLNWEDVCGIQQAKDEMKENVILPVKFPQLSADSKKTQSSGLLLYGPPGTGKTLLAQATVAELIPCHALCYRLSVYDLLSKWQNKNPIEVLQAMFRRASAYKHIVFFIDDIEVLGEQGEGPAELSARVKAELVSQLQNMRTNCPDCSVFIVGITNKPWKLTADQTLRQLLDRHVYIPLPDQNTRYEIFKQQFTSTIHSLTEEHFRMFAERSGGYSGSDIAVVVRDACMEPVRKIQVATHFKRTSGPSVKNPHTLVDDLLTPCSQDDPGAVEMTWMQIEANQLSTQVITVEDVFTALSKVTPSVSREDLDMYQKFRGMEHSMTRDVN